MSEFVSTRCIRCGSPSVGTGQFCAICVEQKRSEEVARAERVTQAIADRPTIQSTTGTLCPACGMWASADARFCGYCRFHFGEAVSGLEARPATGQRIIAGLIDFVLLAVLFGVMAVILSSPEENPNGQGARIGLRNEEFLLYLGFVYAYYVVMELLTSASIGKLMLGLKVVKINGAPYSLGAILVRNLVRFIDSIPGGIYLVGLVAIAVTEKKQRIGDLIVGTTVVKSR